MNNFNFCSPTYFAFGRGTESRAGELCVKYGAGRVLIVYGGGSAVRSGLLARVKERLDEARLWHTDLAGIRPNPTDDRVYEGIDVCRRERIDFILAVGGGSVIDTAKGIAAGAVYDGDFWDFYSGKTVPRSALPVGVVLTIPAAGSEGSGNTVITKVDGLHKISIRTEEVLRPRFAIMDPELTFTLPPFQTACGIADMMAHIMERYFSNTPGVEVSDRLCESVLTTIIGQAPIVMRSPDDYDARANIMWCGMIAHNGTCGVGREEDWSSHALEHEVSAVYDVAHGAGLAVIFPAWLTWMASHNPHKVAQFAGRVFGVEQLASPEATALEGVARLKAFFRSIGLPVTFAALGVANPDIDLLVRKLVEDKGQPIGNYVRLTPQDCREIYLLGCGD